jgi:hypothetical protein
MRTIYLIYFSECKNIPEELDLTSVNLNPLKVLYCENVHLPHKEPTTYNNLAEYENVVIRGNVPKLAKSAASRRAQLFMGADILIIKGK